MTRDWYKGLSRDDCFVFGRNDTREVGRWVSRDAARDAADCGVTELALDDGLTEEDALDGGRVDALEDGLAKGLALLGRSDALDWGLRLGFMEILSERSSFIYTIICFDASTTV